MRSEQWKLRWSEKGPHAKSFDTPTEAITFVAELPKGDFRGVTEVREKPLDMPDLPSGGDLELPPELTFRVRYVAYGIRSKTFDDVNDAIRAHDRLMREIGRDRILGLVHVVETDVRPPASIAVREGQPVFQRPILNVPSAGYRENRDAR